MITNFSYRNVNFIYLNLDRSRGGSLKRRLDLASCNLVIKDKQNSNDSCNRNTEPTAIAGMISLVIYISKLEKGNTN